MPKGIAGSNPALSANYIQYKVTVNFPAPVQNLRKNLQEVEKLISIHISLTKNRKGSWTSVNVLNKSALVLVVACWEAYIEDVARLGYENLVNLCNNPNIIPKKVRSLASIELKKDSDESSVWQLAGDGWRKVLTKYKNDTLKKYIGNFNTPKTEKIDELYENLIGLKSLSKSWHWKGMNQSSKKLNGLVTRRGEIVHRVRMAGTNVSKKEVQGAVEFFQCLAAITSNKVRGHIFNLTGKYPWIGVNFILKKEKVG